MGNVVSYFLTKPKVAAPAVEHGEVARESSNDPVDTFEQSSLEDVPEPAAYNVVRMFSVHSRILKQFIKYGIICIALVKLQYTLLL